MDRDDFYWWDILQKTHPEYISILNENKDKYPWVKILIDDPPLCPGNLNSKCRLGFVPYDQIVKDHFFYIKKNKTMDTVASGGITTQISFDESIDELPQGWQGAVKKSYSDLKENNEPNTLVALLAFTSPRFRGQRLAGEMISRMCERGKELGYKKFLVPALPPSQFERDKVSLGMKQLCEIKRDDGQYYDYWVRLHVKKGARIIGHEDKSHQFVMRIDDFNENVSSIKIGKSGEYLVNFDRDRVLGANGRNMWSNIHVIKELDLVSYNWGCVWVCYDL